MHERENVYCIVREHVHDEMRKATDGVRAPNAFDSAERGKCVRAIKHVTCSLAHLEQERDTETRYDLGLPPFRRYGTVVPDNPGVQSTCLRNAVLLADRPNTRRISGLAR
jgi:hypothetical protein